MYVNLSCGGFETDTHQRCYMCINGNNALMKCYNFPRSLCSNCIIVKGSSNSNAVFFCYDCHNRFFRSQPYKVNILCLMAFSNLTALQFYVHKNNIPPTVEGCLNPVTFHSHPDSFLKINGHFQMTLSSQVDTTRLNIIHFHLSSVKVEGSPAKILADYMSALLPAEALTYREVAFDLSTDKLVYDHKDKIEKDVQDLIGEWQVYFTHLSSLSHLAAAQPPGPSYS